MYDVLSEWISALICLAVERYMVLFCFISQYYFFTDQIVLFQDIKGYRVISLLSESYNQNSKGSSDQLLG